MEIVIKKPERNVTGKTKVDRFENKTYKWSIPTVGSLQKSVLDWVNQTKVIEKGQTAFPNHVLGGHLEQLYFSLEPGNTESRLALSTQRNLNICILYSSPGTVTAPRNLYFYLIQRMHRCAEFSTVGRYRN